MAAIGDREEASQVGQFVGAGSGFLGSQMAASLVGTAAERRSGGPFEPVAEALADRIDFRPSPGGACHLQP